MKEKYNSVIALCIKEGGNGDACVFDDCPLFKDCFPEEFDSLRNLNENKRIS